MQEDNNPLALTMKKCKSLVKYILIFGFVLNCLVLATPLYSMQVLDRVLSSGSLPTLVVLTLGVLFVHFITSLLFLFRNFAMNRIGMWFESSLLPITFLANIKFALRFKNKASSQALRDLNIIRSFLTSTSLITIMDAPWAILFLISLFIMHKLMGLLALISGATLIITGLISDRITRNMINSSNEEFLKSMRYVDQANRNADVIEVMSMQSNITSAWTDIHRNAQILQKKTSDSQAIFAEIMRFIRSSLQIAVTGFGAYLTLQGQFSAGAMIASSTLIGRALAPLEATVNSWKSIISFRQSYKKVHDLLKAVPEHKKAYYSSRCKKNGTKIELSKAFSSPNIKVPAVLKNINLTINPGEIVLIMGNSGSGKTSLASLIAGALTLQSGTLQINEMSMQQYKTSGGQIGYLPQEVNLFYGTVKENIARMDKKADIAKVEAAAKIAGAHAMILKMPKGYDSQIGVSGSSISGGQRQRIALARAFYDSPDLIILDEPNANLDKKGDEALMNAIEHAKKHKKTLIIVSHRTSVASIADKIGIMKNGSLIDYDKSYTIRKEYLEQ